jgi:hypothetical protein
MPGEILMNKLCYYFGLCLVVTACFSSPANSSPDIPQSVVPEPNILQFVYAENVELDPSVLINFEEFRLWSINLREKTTQKDRIEGRYTYDNIVARVTIEYKDASILITFSEPMKRGSIFSDEKYYNEKLLPEWKTFANKIVDEIFKEREFNKSVEEAKNMLIEKANASKELDSPIFILRCKSGFPDHAGGVDVSIFFRNISNKRMKYIYFTVVPYNRVDDIVQSQIDGRSNVILEQVGYIEPEELPGNRGFWENVWYNSTISYAKIVKIEIILDDNSKKIIDDKAMIDKIMLSQEEYDFWDKYVFHDGR